MKTKISKLILFFILFFTIITFFSTKTVSYAATKNKSTEEQLKDSTDENLNKLDTSDLQEFFDKLTADEKGLISNGDVKEAIKAALSGDDNVTFQNIIELLLKYVARSALGFLPALLSIVIISILYGMLSNLNNGFLDKSVDKVVFFACYGAALVILLNEVVQMINLTVTTADRLSGLMRAVFPLLLTLMSALGGVTGAGILKPLMVVASGFIISFISTFIIPCFVVSVVLAVAGNLSDTVKLNKMSQFFKRLAEWSLGLIFGTFITTLTVKGIVGRTADGVAVNAAKFALSGYVPVLGSYISDGFDVVMAGCILIKNALGVTGLILMLSIVLLPVIKLAVFTLALKFAAAATEPMGDGKMSDLLTAVSKSTGLLVSSLIGLAFMFFAVVMLVSSSCNLGVA